MAVSGGAHDEGHHHAPIDKESQRCTCPECSERHADDLGRADIEHLETALSRHRLEIERTLLVGGLLAANRFQQANGMVLWAAYAHLCWGEALARRGESVRARESGERALELAHAHGYGAFEERAAALVAGSEGE